jgi:hypothetical protein
LAEGRQRVNAMPVRRAASMAGRLAGGDLATRMPETGVGEVGTLERAFNAMASELFDAVVVDAHRLLGADATCLVRYGPDGEATVLAGRGAGCGARGR